MKINFHWPYRPDDLYAYAPWYVIAWRFLWLPLLFIGGATYLLGILLTFGVNDARSMYNNMRSL